jgi:hypothetical protein
MMISLSMGFSVSLTACRYLLPDQPSQPAKYRKPMVGICAQQR